MNKQNRNTPLSPIARGLLFTVVSVVGVASILASGGGGGGSSRKAPSVDYSVLPATPLEMSTSSTDTSKTDAALAVALGQLDLSDIGSLVENALVPFSIPSYSNEPCPDGGTSSLTVNLATAGMLTAGDNYTAAFSACNDDGLIGDGSLATKVINEGYLNQAGLSSSDNFINATLQLDYNNLAFSYMNNYAVTDGDMTLHGDHNDDYLRVTVSGSSVAFADNSQTLRLSNYILWAGEDDTGDFHISTGYALSSTVLGGVFQVVTETPFIIASGDTYPSTGVLTVTGADGNGVRLTTIDANTVRLDYEITGDGQFNDLPVQKDWSELPINSTDIIVLKSQTMKPDFSFDQLLKVTP